MFETILHSRARNRPGLAAVAAWLLLALLGMLTVSAAHAIFGENPEDWLCIQRYVPDISVGSVWARDMEQLYSEQEGSWRDSSYSEIVIALSSRTRLTNEEALNRLKRWAAELPETVKSSAVKTILIGLSEHIDEERKKILEGILRFGKKQKNLLHTIQSLTKEVEEQKTAANPETASASMEALEAKQRWAIRAFEQREKQSAYICEQAVLMQQRFYLLGRELVNVLDSSTSQPTMEK